MKKTIATYDIIEELTRGSISVVYKAYQPSLDRIILLKVLQENLATEPDIVARFQREAKACAKIKHENIVDIFDYGVDQGKHYIAMEYVHGISIEQLLQKVTNIPLDIVIFITIEVLKGLAFAHSHGILHRDIKPGNILLSFQGEVKITDFGLALISDSKTITLQNTILGTPAYMSPEQISGDELDGRSDIFSLGVTVYEMLTKKQAFGGETHMESLNNVLNKEPAKLESLRPDLAAGLAQIVKKMIAKKVSRRYNSCELIISELTSFARQTKLTLSKENLRTFLKNTGSAAAQPDRADVSLTNEKSTRKPRLITAATLILFLIGISYALLTFYFTPADEFKKVNPPQENAALFSKPPADSSPAAQKETLNQPASTPIAELPISSEEVGSGAPDHTDTSVAQVSKNTTFISETPAAAEGTLVIKCAPWAKVFIDGHYQKTLYELDSLVVTTTPGSHEIVFVNSSYAPYDTAKKTIVLAAGETKRLIVPFTDIVAVGFLKISVRPWAEVFIDDMDKGTTPLDPIILKKGRHHLTLKHPQFPTWERDIEIHTGEIKEFVVDLTQQNE